MSRAPQLEQRQIEEYQRRVRRFYPTARETMIEGIENFAVVYENENKYCVMLGQFCTRLGAWREAASNVVAIDKPKQSTHIIGIDPSKGFDYGAVAYGHMRGGKLHIDKIEMLPPKDLCEELTGVQKDTLQAWEKAFKEKESLLQPLRDAWTAAKDLGPVPDDEKLIEWAVRLYKACEFVYDDKSYFGDCNNSECTAVMTAQCGAGVVLGRIG